MHDLFPCMAKSSEQCESIKLFITLTPIVIKPIGAKKYDMLLA